MPYTPLLGEAMGEGTAEDNRKRQQQFTWDLAATSQSPVRPIFGTAGAWGVKTAGEDKNPVRHELWFSKPLPSMTQLPKGHVRSSQGIPCPVYTSPSTFLLEAGSPKLSSVCHVRGTCPHPVSSSHPLPHPHLCVTLYI